MHSRLTAFVLAIGLLTGVAGSEHARSDIAVWREIAWPFPRDAWPAGRAFQCTAAACGEEVEIYVRPKIGFCNCEGGVADDDEVDRVADLDMISQNFVPLAPGNVVRVADMPGRSRAYDLEMTDGSHHAAIGIALSHRCDLLVAVAQAKAAAPALQHMALKFLASHEMTDWIMSALGGH